MMTDSNTSIYAVIGNPVSHSLSPAMHNAAFAYVGFNGVYCALHVEDIGAAMTGLRALGIQGASITIPHKVDVMAHIDEIDDLAHAIGAVNTIVNRKGRLIGYNSDGLGAVKALTEKTDLNGKSVALLGAGGAARAIGFSLLKAGAKVLIVNRSHDSGKKLSEDLGSPFLPLSDIGIQGLDCDILVNTTPVGMHPNAEASPVDKRLLDRRMMVMDIVYNPLKTRLLKDASLAGCIAIDGVAMFVNQGAFQFELWTKVAAPVDVMKHAVLANL